MPAYLLHSESMSVVGYQESDVTPFPGQSDYLFVASPDDLKHLTLQQLTDAYNSACKAAFEGMAVEPAPKFKIAKDKAIAKVWAEIQKIPLDKLNKVEPKGEEEPAPEKEPEQPVNEETPKPEEPEFFPVPDPVEPTQPVQANGKKPRKVRDSKLQRMKAAFLDKDEEGNYKSWSVPELMARCDTSDRITVVYISILRSPSDRFVMNIEKIPGENGTEPRFIYRPKEQRQAPQEPTPQETEVADHQPAE